ncbi:MAG: acyl-CoA dehydrogenase family protein [Parvibaculum sp.]|nr:acyl-CoA dehydrogenase family protein [Parvibaculum sp.]|tara:strand:- start:580 stop:1605 length:1026 start_codon:yes stop_codon:yes gene_type:complete
MNEVQTLLSDSVNRLLKDHATKQVIVAAEQGEWPAALWDALVANGLTRVLVPEEMDGAGATWSDAYVVLKAAGEYAAPVPLAEAIVAGWLLSRAGIAVPEGIITLMEGDFLLKEGRLTGKAIRVPFGRYATHGVALVKSGWGVEVVLAPLEYVRIENDMNVAREARDTLTFERVVAETGWIELPANGLRLFGAMARSVQMAGALDYLTTQSVAYANERAQFGKPIGKFQAIQQQLAVLSTQSAAAGIAAAHACAAADKGEAAFEIAVAKVRTDDASSIATSIAHQVHGAIGFTYEHGLHFATRRLWAWRAEFGSGAEWAGELGRAAMERGADELWPYVTGR